MTAINNIDVHGLPAKWRKEANTGLFTCGDGPAFREALNDCADELEAALRQSGEAVEWQRKYARTFPTGGMCSNWHNVSRDEYEAEVNALSPDRTYEYRALYAAPPATSGLVEALREALEAGDDGDWQSARNVIHAALAAHDARGGK